MASTYPSEILDHIVGLVRAGDESGRTSALLSLCMVNKALHPIAQCYLYQNLVRTILRKPSLGSHVEKLSIMFIAEVEVGSQYVTDMASALGSMNRIRDLQFIYDRLERKHWQTGGAMDFSDVEASLGEKTLASIVQSPSLERMTIHRFWNWPFYMIPRAPTLRHLDLVSTTLNADSRASIRGLKDHIGPSLASLKVDARSVDNWLTPLEDDTRGIDKPSQGHVFDLSHLRSLDVGLPRDVVEREVQGWRTAILAKPHQLHYLHFRLEGMSFPTHMDRWVACPLVKLRPSSLKSLVHLQISIKHWLMVQGRAIRNPYGCMWDDVLQRLARLESFQIDMEISGNLNLDVERSIGPQWSILPDAIFSSRTACPMLKEFSVCLRVLVDNETPEDIAGAESFLHSLTTTIYPLHIHPGRHVTGVARNISFAFRVEHELGEKVELYFSEEYA
ncbi:hypothetical protein NMY22_g9966 [Coprinellus aureogranulatus]|nr:hypothetical protein NMY22_g9966 [Coprinellus aureogranulatus]